MKKIQIKCCKIKSRNFSSKKSIWKILFPKKEAKLTKKRKFTNENFRNTNKLSIHLKKNQTINLKTDNRTKDSAWLEITRI
jgi:hypothetical protein